MAGLPVEKQLTPGLFSRASARVGLISKIVSKPLEKLNPALLPAVLLLDNNEACLLMGWNLEKDQARVVYPDLSEAVVDVPVRSGIIVEHHRGRCGCKLRGGWPED